MSLTGATVAGAIWHEEHGVDQDCAVCRIRHQPATEPSALLHVGYADVAEPIEPADDNGWIAPSTCRCSFPTASGCSTARAAFSVGTPDALSRSGALGRAFDTDAIRFSPSQGRFEIRTSPVKAERNE